MMKFAAERMKGAAPRRVRLRRRRSAAKLSKFHALIERCTGGPPLLIPGGLGGTELCSPDVKKRVSRGPVHHRGKPTSGAGEERWKRLTGYPEALAPWLTHLAIPLPVWHRRKS